MTLVGGLGTSLGPVVGAFIIVRWRTTWPSSAPGSRSSRASSSSFCVLTFRRGIVGEIATYAEGRRKGPRETEAAATADKRRRGLPPHRAPTEGDGGGGAVEPPDTSVLVPALARRTPRSLIRREVALQAGTLSLATSKLYTRAVLPPATWPAHRPAPRPGSQPGSCAIGEMSTAVRIVRAPHHAVDADDVAQANADGVLLEAQDDVAVEEVAREHAVFEPVECLAVALAVGVVHGRERARYHQRPGC